MADDVANYASFGEGPAADWPLVVRVDPKWYRAPGALLDDLMRMEQRLYAAERDLAALRGATSPWRLKTDSCDCNDGTCTHGEFPWRVVTDDGRDLIDGFGAGVSVEEGLLMAQAPALAKRNAELVARVAELEDTENFRCSDCGATYTQTQLDADRADAAEAQVRELTERAETAEQIAQARDELLGQWIAKVERAAEIEAELARVGEAMRDERRRRLLVVADLTRVRRAVEMHGDRVAVAAMRKAFAGPEVASEPASGLEVGSDASTQLATDLGTRVEVVVKGNVAVGRYDGTQVYVSTSHPAIGGDLWLDEPDVTVTSISRGAS